MPPARRFFIFFSSSYGGHRALHSFPTRRSSDLGRPEPGELARVARLDCQTVAAARFGVHAEDRRRQPAGPRETARSEEHTSELQSHHDLVCRLLLEKKKKPQHQKLKLLPLQSNN